MHWPQDDGANETTSMAETGKGVVGVDLCLQASFLLHIKEMGAEGMEKLLREIFGA